MSSEAVEPSVKSEKISPAKSENSGNVESSPEIASPPVAQSDERERPVIILRSIKVTAA